MAITYRCTTCGKEFESAEGFAGRPVQCDACRQSAASGPPLSDQTLFVSLDQIRKQKGEKEEPEAPQEEGRAQTIDVSFKQIRQEEDANVEPQPQGAMVAPRRQFRMEIETEEDNGGPSVLGDTMVASAEKRKPTGLKELGVGIIGVGWMGQKHAEALADIHGARLVAVADAFKETAERVGGDFDVDFYVDPRKLAQRDDVDCVIIATNDEAHVQPVAAAAAGGKHILLEKPIATTLSDADQIIRLCERANVKLMIGFILRFDNRYARVQEAVANGEIGELESIFCRRTNLVTSQERLKGRVSVLSFLGVHDFDMMRWVAGSEVKRVHTEAVWNLHRKHGFDVEDTTWTLLRFENGVIGSLETGWVVPTTHPTKADFKLEVTGTKGMITYDLTRQELMFTTEAGHYSERFNPMLQYQLEHFLDCVRNDRDPLVTGIDGRAALEISLAAQQSAKSEQIVPLPLT
ncbi:MAG: Gfo/Idh/MocA family oxidoreductase [Planctomycetes bacterium]|nr:Gfo/Idh/MocA family oxidoreductase [Planctomycetota bacterium]